MRRYNSIVFLQGADAEEAEAEISRSCGDAWPRSVEWQRAAFEYLSDWSGGYEDWREEPGYGTEDGVYDYVDEFGAYQISYNLLRGYIGLTEVKDS